MICVKNCLKSREYSYSSKLDFWKKGFNATYSQLDIDPGTALRRGNTKFERRFRAMEDAAGGQDGLESMGLAEMEALWKKVKRTVNNHE